MIPPPQKSFLLHCAVPVVLALIFLYIRAWHPLTYLYLLSEDRILEMTQAVFYATSFFVGIATTLNMRKAAHHSSSLILMAFSAGMLLLAMEEISWGQRIIGFQTPAFIAAHNSQMEFNFHNIRPIHNTLNYFYLLFTLLAALACLSRAPLERRYGWPICHLLPEWHYAGYFLVAFCWCLDLQLDLFSNGKVLWAEQEVAEFLVPLAFYFYVSARYRDSLALIPPHSARDTLTKADS